MAYKLIEFLGLDLSYDNTLINVRSQSVKFSLIIFLLNSYFMFCLSKLVLSTFYVLFIKISSKYRLEARDTPKK